MKIAILMLTHNATRCVYKSLSDLRRANKDYAELIVVDNASNWITQKIVKRFHARGVIHKLLLSSVNTLFAKGNNLASRLAADDITHYLLLNSDIEIKDPHWLKNLIAIHPAEGGISSYGAVQSTPPERTATVC